MAIGIGFDRFAYTFPMFDADGNVIGIHRRDPEGRKSTVEGGANGLFIPAGVTPHNLQVICEGMSDTAASLTFDYAAIGTPGAGVRAGVVADFVRRGIKTCPCIVGDTGDAERQGAERLRDAILAAGRPCRLLFPPDGFKDLREWLVSGLTASDLWGAIARQKVLYPKPADYPPGFSMLPHALVRCGLIREVGTTATAVLLAIASFTGSDGIARVTREQLAEVVGCKTRTVERSCLRLREVGVLSWKSGRTGLANEYRIDWGPCRHAKQRYSPRPALT